MLFCVYSHTLASISRFNGFFTAESVGVDDGLKKAIGTTAHLFTISPRLCIFKLKCSYMSTMC